MLRKSRRHESTRTALVLDYPVPIHNAREHDELPKGHGTRRKPFSDAEAKAIISAAAESQTGVRDQAIIVLALAAGFRPIEVWQLQLSDVDLRAGWVSIRLETTKTDSGARDVPVDPQVVALLDTCINDVRGSREGPLFLNAHGDPLTHWGFMNIHYWLRNRLKAKGIDGSWRTARATRRSRTGSVRASRRRSSSSMRDIARSSRRGCTSAV